MYRFAFRKLRGGGQICEQGSFKGARLICVPMAHGKLGGLGACSPRKFLKKGML